MTLDSAAVGQVVSVAGTRAATTALTRRLRELGIRPGAKVRILTRTSGGGAIVAITDDRLAVSRSILAAVEVTAEVPASE